MKITKLIIFIIVILSLTQILLTHRLSTTGEEVRLQELKIADLEQENRKLTEEINEVGSLAKISLQAAGLGLVRTSQVVHLVEQIPVALK